MGVQQLTELVTTRIEPILDAMPGARRAIPIPEDELRYELRGLRYSAVRLAIGALYGADLNAAQQAMAAVDAELGRTAAAGLREREIGYLAAMIVFRSNDAMFQLPAEATHLQFSGNAVADVGLLFAYHCSAARHPIVPLVGANIFGTVFAKAKAILAGAEDR